jgi:galactoside O-acetyltransferase
VKTHAAITGQGSALGRYQDVMVGSRSLMALIVYEFCMLLAPVPGALGMVLRKLFWPRMFGSCGKGCMFAAGIVVRHPGRIRLGRSVVISEGCVLDGRHGSTQDAIVLGDNVILSNGVMLSCKNGTITIGGDTGLNAQTIVQSTNDCPVSIGKDCILGQRCLVIAGGSYNMDQLDIPIRRQGIRNDGGLVLEDNVWLGGNVTVLGGVTMGSGSVAAAGAVLTKSVPVNSVNMGVPARTVRTRSA